MPEERNAWCSTLNSKQLQPFTEAPFFLPMYLIYDTETTGLPKKFDAPLSDSDNWPRLVQLAWQLHDADGELMDVRNFIIRPDGFTIPFNATQVHGITTERAMQHGLRLEEVLKLFEAAVSRATVIAGHNIEFDLNIVGAEHHRLGMESDLLKKVVLDTKEESTDYCQIPGGKGGKFKWPTLTELHLKLFSEGFDEAHNAAADVEATARCFLELLRLGVISQAKSQLDPDSYRAFQEAHQEPIEAIGLNVQPYERPAEKSGTNDFALNDFTVDPKLVSDDLVMAESIAERYVHLHVHSQFSVLQATSVIPQLTQKAADLGMKALALTDTGNMYGAFAFIAAAEKAGIKPIVGYEAYVCEDHLDRTHKDDGRLIPLLALNQTGYENLAKLSSIAFTDGYYYVPRIDKKLLEAHKEGVIALSGGLSGEVPYLLLNVGEKQAEEAFCWWKDTFGENFYVEINRHRDGQQVLEAEEVVNSALLRFCEQYKVPYFAAHETFYIEPEDAEAQDILLCVKDNTKQTDPVGRGRGFRYAMPNQQYYFKQQEEMAELFVDLPEALECTATIADRIEPIRLQREVLLPKFDIPQVFIDPLDDTDGGKRGENAYLRHLTYEGARERYGEINSEVKERIDFELETIANTGYPGYFLIVQDFTRAARDMGVSVGPGRGSAAGSVVAYCIGITNVDPLKYGLLFERFLNPDRVSLPDIDIDFDDEGRDRVIQYVIDKYGKEQVAHIITYGTMAAKSALRDTARVMEIPIEEVNSLAKLMPDNLDWRTLLDSSDKQLAEKINNREQLNNAMELRRIASEDDRWNKVLRTAMKIEGSLRNTGIHACGVIITPSRMDHLVPVMMPKGAMMMATQFDNSVVESAGLLKMDFLGLKTLSIIKTAIDLVQRRHGITIDPDAIPLDDEKTMELFAKGETTGLFQFESVGMQKNLRLLRPTKFEDIIAMNALYRPGPMEYIPKFAARKNGEEAIAYDLPVMEEVLAETYGITVYQEQVMMLSRILADFSRGEADKLRKAMGKKIKAQLDILKPKFMEGATKNGHPEEVLEKVWSDWEAFAKYAFNKSHSACYSVVAWQTAYLKANYPAEYMAAILSHNLSDQKKVNFFIEECKRMGIQVLGPDVNESLSDFSVNTDGQIRFGLQAIKGIGGAVCEAIVEEREANGAFKSFFDFLSRVATRSINTKTLEALAYTGAFDQLTEGKRSLFFAEEDGKSFLEKAVRYASSLHESRNSAQVSLFGDDTSVSLPEPQMPDEAPWPRMYKLKKEREYLSIYLSSHPLDDYKKEMELFTNTDCAQFDFMMNGNQEEAFRPGEYNLGGYVSSVRHGVSKTGREYGVLVLEDYSGSVELFTNGESYLKFRHLMELDRILYLRVMADSWTKKDAEGNEKMNRRSQIQHIMLMEDVMNSLVSTMTLHVALEILQQEWSDKLMKELEPFWDPKEGKPFDLQLRHEDLQLRLRKRKDNKLRLDHELLKLLAQLGIGVQLNK